MGFLGLLSLSGNAKQAALAELEAAVMAAEQEAADDSARRSPCEEKEKRWRAPIQSLTQDIRIQRCQVVYYYLATYSMAGGSDVSPVAFLPSLTFLGTEDLSTGEKRPVHHE